MKHFNYVIKDELGIHARPAGLLTKEVKKYESKVTISLGEKSAPAKAIMAVMALGVEKGSEITVSAEGPDEDTAIAELKAFFEANL